MIFGYNIDTNTFVYVILQRSEAMKVLDEVTVVSEFHFQISFSLSPLSCAVHSQVP